MSVKFSEIVIVNSNSIEIDIEVTVQTQPQPYVVRDKIVANGRKVLSINQINVKSTKITATALAHEPYPDSMTFDFDKAGIPHAIYIEKIEVSTSIGSIRGSVSVGFNHLP